MYVASCLVIPEKVIKEINQRIFRFLWGKRDRIKRKTIVSKVEKGGLNMIDLKSHITAVHATWAHHQNDDLHSVPKDSHLSYYFEDKKMSA